ncbi:hypothetical protein ACB098_08G014000 [Castanea mollissima]|uniref:Uncharacterized protein n=1 Tax=Castanea mollissima TaxID=60419 RepID=A0A8J4RKK3_9ROSI|nr:hypothetical protein CMV_005953 [Castanea mollissima]
MICDKNVANAVGGKTARACDSCVRKRARWYCPADDAFLCQVCDSSVHSANQLARRHERVRLKTASFKSSDAAVQNSVPSWHRGFTRKARTPRHGKPVNYQTPKSKEPLRNPFPIVPEVGADEISHEENEEQLLYRVPIFDPFVAELCTPTTPKEAVAAVNSSPNGSETKVLLANCGHDVDNLHGFIPSDMDLAEFAADVESLLGRGLENECFGMEELGLMDCKEKVMKEGCLGSGRVKVEEEEGTESVTACLVDDSEIDMMREPFELSFDYDSPATCEEEDEKAIVMRNIDGGGYEAEDKKKKKKILLRLDYGAVIAAWASQGSPWTNGDRPDFDPDECWPDCMGTCSIDFHHPYGDFGGTGGNPAMVDGGREARVSRYREKRRTRLFSKKIRYEVRKLNAEKRPRMKGRFVKRASFAAGPAFPLLSK